MTFIMLKERLKKDMVEAMKTGDRLKRMVLGTLWAAIKNRELNKRGSESRTVTDLVKWEEAGQLNDEEVREVIASEVKKRKESVEQFTSGGRSDLAQQEQREIGVLSAYLPEQLGEDEIKREVRTAILQLGAKDPKEMGKVIGAVRAKLKGRVDGGLVSKIAKELISKSPSP